jgi:16S rRNA U516 pseudouridylate synthase RsuA-like enzyme
MILYLLITKSYQTTILMNTTNFTNQKDMYVLITNKESAPTIYDLIGKNYLKFGGRLDKDSEGLMLLSTDGEWLNEIFHSKNKIEKNI